MSEDIEKYKKDSFPLDNLLNYIKQYIVIQIGDIQLKYDGTTEDTFNGKIEHFKINRKVEW